MLCRRDLVSIIREAKEHARTKYGKEIRRVRLPKTPFSYPCRDQKTSQGVQIIWGGTVDVWFK